jgi:hypothetical protein
MTDGSGAKGTNVGSFLFDIKPALGWSSTATTWCVLVVAGESSNVPGEGRAPFFRLFFELLPPSPAVALISAEDFGVATIFPPLPAPVAGPGWDPASPGPGPIPMPSNRARPSSWYRRLTVRCSFTFARHASQLFRGSTGESGFEHRMQSRAPAEGDVWMRLESDGRMPSCTTRRERVSRGWEGKREPAGDARTIVCFTALALACERPERNQNASSPCEPSSCRTAAHGPSSASPSSKPMIEKIWVRGNSGKKKTARNMIGAGCLVGGVWLRHVCSDQFRAKTAPGNADAH